MTYFLGAEILVRCAKHQYIPFRRLYGNDFGREKSSGLFEKRTPESKIGGDRRSKHSIISPLRHPYNTQMKELLIRNYEAHTSMSYFVIFRA